jgi:hypothetical protein
LPENKKIKIYTKTTMSNTMSNTFNKNSKQISFFGALATTIATTCIVRDGNKQKSHFFQDVDSWNFADTNGEAVEAIKTNRKGGKTFCLSEAKDGSGGKHAVGKTLVNDQIWSDIQANFQAQTQILFGCVGGGTFGSLCEVAHRLQAEGKKVIIFCFDLWSSDNSAEGNHSQNRKDAVEALANFSHCFLSLPTESVVGACEAVKGCLDNFASLLSCIAVDSNDWTNVLSKNSQFCLVVSQSMANTVGQKLALTKTLQSVGQFSNRAGAKLTNYIAIVGSPTGELELAKSTKVELNLFLSNENSCHRKAVPVISDTASYTILATL